MCDLVAGNGGLMFVGGICLVGVFGVWGVV